MQFLVEIGPVKNPIITRLTDPIIGEQEGVQLEPPTTSRTTVPKLTDMLMRTGIHWLSIS